MSSAKNSREENRSVGRTKTQNLEVVAPTVALDWPRVIALILAVLGVLVSGYLAWAEVTGAETVCLNTGAINCETVQNSAYSSTFGIPVAVLGFVGFVGMLVLLLLEDQIPFLAAYGRTLVAGAALFGVLFQAYLTVIEATVLEAWCQWCVLSFIIVTLLFAVSAFRLYRFLQPLRS